MNTEEFKQYQRQLNVQRVNQINSVPKLTPKVLIQTEDLDVFLEDIPLTITLPSVPVTKQPEHIVTNPKDNPLF